MIVNRFSLLEKAPIIGMSSDKNKAHGVSWGLTEAGYDIRVKQTISFFKDCGSTFVLASSVEEFDMPNDLVGIVHDKSTWARQGLSVFNTVIEPGWKGFLTLELVYHGSSYLTVPEGSGIAQVIFHQLTDSSCYTGKYQDQEDLPVKAKFI
jgi:dCTP deaminase